MVSAWAAANGVSIGQEQVGPKSNEIKAIPRLIEALDLKDCIVTIDAIACQHDIVGKLAKKKVDYAICVKSNQGKLHDTLHEWFWEIDMEGNRITFLRPVTGCPVRKTQGMAGTS